MILIKEGNNLFFSNFEHEKLNSIPSGVYILVKDAVRGFILSSKDTVSELPSKIYGDSEQVADRIVTKFKLRGFGVLFTGLKGSGKTLLTKLIAKKANAPIIFVTEAFSGAEFNAFMSVINQPVIVVFDEFEKIYDTVEKQNEILSLLDGLNNPSDRKLFILTSNTLELSNFLFNRTGRVLYHKTFGGLTSAEINDIIDDNLTELEHKYELVELCGALAEVSIDVLLSWIEEINQFKESPREAMKLLNISPERANFRVTLLVDGGHFESEIDFHPLQFPEYSIYYKAQGDRYWDYKSYKVRVSDFIRTFEDGVIEMEKKDGKARLVFRKTTIEKMKL